jgi:hypothetical protein
MEVTMSFIGKLPGFNSVTVPHEQQGDVTPQPATQPATRTGIAKTSDGFETTNPMTANLFGLAGEQTEILVSNQMSIAPDPTVDVSMLFDYVTDVRQPGSREATDPMSRTEFRPDPMEKFESAETEGKATEETARDVSKAESEKLAELKAQANEQNLARIADQRMSIGHVVGDLGEWTVEAAEDIAEAAAAAAEEAAKAAAKAAEDAAAAAAQAAEDAINEVGEVLEDVGEAVGDVADDVGEFLGDLW